MSVTPRLFVFAGNGRFAATTLRELCAAGIAIDTVVSFGFGGGTPCAAPFRVAPPARPDSLPQLAEQHGIRHAYVDKLDARTLQRRLPIDRAEVLLSVCFPRRLPAWLQHSSATACCNLHPSLLPAYRGPAPLFWQYRNGEQRIGVTLHQISDELDAGPVITQRRVMLGDGMRYAEIADRLARVGAVLFCDALPAIVTGVVRHSEQNPRERSYFPVPQAADFVLEPQWSARRAFNFMRATEHYCQPYRLTQHGLTVLLARATGFSDAHRKPDHQLNEGTIAVEFTRGTLYARPVDTGERHRAHVGLDSAHATHR